MMSSCTNTEVLHSFEQQVTEDGFGTQQEPQPDPDKYVRIQDEDVSDFLRYIETQQHRYAEWVVLTQAQGLQPNSTELLTPQDSQEIQRLQNYTSGNLDQQLSVLREQREKEASGPTGLQNSLENWQQDWLLIDREQYQLQQQLLLQPGCPTDHNSAPFFQNWPSFNVADKLIVVSKASGAAFTLGFTLGIQTALRSFFDMVSRPIIATGAALATVLGAYLSPQLLLTAVGYVAVGGVIGGTAMAVPVFVVGSTGVFAAAGVYHSYIAAKRLVVGNKQEDGCSTPLSSSPSSCSPGGSPPAPPPRSVSSCACGHSSSPPLPLSSPSQPYLGMPVPPQSNLQCQHP